MIKKFTTFLLAFAIVLSISTPRSSAAGGAIGTVVVDFAKGTFAAVTAELVLRAAKDGLETYFSKPQTKEFAENLIAEGIFTIADYIAAGYTDQDIYDQFTNYNAAIESQLGSVSLNPYRIFYNWPVYALDIRDSSAIISFTPGSSWSFSVTGTYGAAGVRYDCGNGSNEYSPPVVGGTLYLWGRITSMIDCIYSSGWNNIRSDSMYSYSFSSLNPQTISTSFDRSYYGSPYSASGNSCYGYYQLPAGVTVQSLLTNVDISESSRPTSLVTPIAIQNADETYTVYNNITLVDEGNKVVFDPTTGESITFTDWAYDYESRTYDLTLDGGGSMTVQFGNDSITMTQGDTVTNIFYVQDPADDPGTDNPDDPDNPGTDADVSGFFAWWKNAWNGFVDRLFTVLDGGDLEVILPGEEGNPEDEEDDGWTVFDLFALIRDALWKIITGVITVVLDGFLGLVDAIASLGDFFDIYDPANPDGIFGVPGGGVELWS